MAHKLLARLIDAYGMQSEVAKPDVVEPTVEVAATTGPRKMRRKPSSFSKRNSYASYLHRVLKKIHPDIGISKKAMQIMDSFVADMFERIMAVAAELARSNKRHTITAREIQHSVRLVLPGSLATHAIADAHRHYTMFCGRSEKI